ncbi:hypothetical protein LCGC14_2135420, partial [marine sediment metagenome]
LVAAPETSTPERRAFTDDIRKAANVLGINKYKELLDGKTIREIPEKEFDKYRKKFFLAVDEVSEGEEGGKEKPAF